MLALALSLAATAPPPAVVDHDKPPPGAVARIGETRFRVVGGSVHLSADGKEVIVAGPDDVRLLDPATGCILATIPVQGNQLTGLAYDPKNGRLTLLGHAGPPERAGPDDYALWAVDVPAREVGRPVPLPPFGTDLPFRWAATPDGSRVVTGGSQSLRVWDGRTADRLAAISRADWPGAILALPDGKVLVCNRGAAELWDGTADGKPRRLAAPAKATFPEFPAAAAAAGGRAYLGGDGAVLVYDAATGEPKAPLAVGRKVRALAVTADGKTLAVALDGPKPGGVAVWDLTTGKELRRLPVGRGYVHRLTWSADGARLAAVVGGRLWVWDATTGEPVTPPPAGHDGPVDRVAFAADGRLVTGGFDTTVRVWDAATGQPGPPLELSNAVRAVAVSPDGALVAGSGGGDDLRIWDSKTGAVRHMLPGNGRLGGGEVLGFSPDGKRLVTWGRTLRLRVWDPATGQKLADHPTYLDGETTWSEDDQREATGTLSFRPFALSADASRLAARFGHEFRVYDTATGKELPRFDFPPAGAGGLAFAPDGKRLAVSGVAEGKSITPPDGSEKLLQAEVHPLTVRDVEAGKVVWEAKAAGKWAEAVAFSPDGKTLAVLAEAAGKGPGVQWFDAATGKEQGRIAVAPPQRLNGLAFAFDAGGRRVAIPLADGTVGVYELKERK